LLAQVHAELGDTSRAQEYLNRIADQCVLAHLDTVYSVRAVVAARQGMWDEAERYAEEALAFARRGGFIVSEARLFYFWGRWLTEHGETERARERLEESLAIFRRLGARPYVERIERMLADIGDR
jgi:tetratricopeptide (TPR) repeat protein